MTSFFRFLAVSLTGLVLVGLAVFVVNPLQASGTSAPIETLPAAVVVSDVSEPVDVVEAAPVPASIPPTTAAPAPKPKTVTAAKAAPVKTSKSAVAASAPVATSTSGDSVEIGTACVMERTATGEITSSGC